MIIRVEALRQFNSLSSDMEDMEPLTVESIILELGAYFFLLIFYQSKSAQCVLE